MRFGNWKVNEEGIEWVGSVGEYFIHKSRLNETGHGERSGMFDFLVHLTEKTWLSQSDIIDLNEAYQFAFNHFGIEMDDSLSMEDTLTEQNKLMKNR
ncbi:MAG: hypothetical protein COA32_01515 [Fluviicola sp.]|nr:MAG: hypothetical protein COA32_01515 [Fluviicola sp.]